jgi:hypothetical protein
MAEVNAREITEQETAQVLKDCPNGSAAGLDKIPYEALRYGGQLPVECLTLIFQISWKSELHPSRWDEALVTPLFKGGPDPHNVNKYRAITLLCTPSKLYEGILLRQMLTVLDTCAEESTCPLCARVQPRPPSDYAPEFLQHLTSECPHLRLQQTKLRECMHRALAEAGNLRLSPSAPHLTWEELPANQQIGLLLGNPTSALLATWPDPSHRARFMESLLPQAWTRIDNILARREHLIWLHYLETHTD